MPVDLADLCDPSWVAALQPYEGRRVRVRCGVAGCGVILGSLAVFIDGIHFGDPPGVWIGEDTGTGPTVTVGGKVKESRPQIRRRLLVGNEVGNEFATTIEWRCKRGHTHRRNTLRLRPEFLRCVRAGADLLLG